MLETWFGVMYVKVEYSDKADSQQRGPPVDDEHDSYTEQSP